MERMHGSRGAERRLNHRGIVQTSSITEAFAGMLSLIVCRTRSMCDEARDCLKMEMAALVVKVMSTLCRKCQLTVACVVLSRKSRSLNGHNVASAARPPESGRTDRQPDSRDGLQRHRF